MTNKATDDLDELNISIESARKGWAKLEVFKRWACERHRLQLIQHHRQVNPLTLECIACGYEWPIIHNQGPNGWLSLGMPVLAEQWQEK